ncbi:MAG: 3'(2'),5'-bisphosphate nucleotidase CysQ [bacterium]
MMLTEELNVATEIIKEAGQIILDFYHRKYDVELKNEREPVTQADKASNAFITEQLARQFPDDAILAEESKDDFKRLQKSRVWVVDPMDGTKEFIDKVGQFAAMIGLVENGRPVLGLVYQPTSAIFYWAVRNQGAYMIQNGQKSELHVSNVTEIDQLKLVISRSHRAELVDTMKEALGIHKEVASGSVGLKVGLLAQKKCDLYLHPNSKTKEWDTCAPEIILQEAGGTLTDCWGQPLKYNKENVYNDKGFVASNGTRHAEIIEKIAPFLDQLT